MNEKKKGRKMEEKSFNHVFLFLKNQKPKMTEYQKQVVVDVSGRIINEKKNRGYGLFWDTGTGKTATVINIIKNVRKVKNEIKFVIVCPASLKQHWIEEMVKWGLEDNLFSWEEKKNVVCVKKENKTIGKIMSYEMFRKIYEKEKEEDIAFLKTSILVYDEVHRLKNFQTKTTKTAKKVSKYAYYRIGMTATPYTTSPFNLWNILMSLNIYVMSYKEFTKALKYEKVWAGRMRGYINVAVGFKDMDFITKRTAYYISKVKKSEVRGQMPSIVYKNYFVSLSPEQKKIYKLLRRTSKNIFELFTLLNILDNGVEEFMQSGSEKVKAIKEVVGVMEEKRNEKVEVLKSIIEEVGDNQVIVFTQFRRTAEKLYRVLSSFFTGKKIRITYGGDQEKQRKIDEFKSKKFDILITTDTLSEGVDFPDVDYLINYDIHPNPARMIQRAGRIHRLGSKNGKTIINIIGAVVGKELYLIMKDRYETIIELESKMIKEQEIIRKVMEKLGFKEAEVYPKTL